MDRFAPLNADIERELRNLERLVHELDQVLAMVPEGSVAKVRATGSVLHDFYTGVEKIFRLIASRADQDLPMGEDWHIQLLQRMSVSIEGIRPHVISEGLEKDLEEYLRFRHLFRNIYGFDLKWERCQPLAENLGEILANFKEQIDNFKAFLDSI